MQWLNYHHLYYFYVIANHGSVTAATTELKLAQSTLSAQLRQFETVLGYKLFERKGRKLVLTDVGTRVYDYAHEIFCLGDELRDSLKSLEGSTTDVLRIGVMDSIPKRLCQDLILRTATYHGARTIIFEESLRSLMQRLEAHEIDVILANDKPPTDGARDRFHAKLIGELKVIFVVTPDRASYLKDMPRSLNGQPMIMPGLHSPLRNEVMEFFKFKHIQPHVIAEVDDLELQKRLALSGLGFTAVPHMAVEEELRSGALIRLNETPICHENLWLITGHRLVQNPIVKQLLAEYRPLAHDQSKVDWVTPTRSANQQTEAGKDAATEL